MCCLPRNHSLKNLIMSIDKRKFKREVTQDNPTKPSGKTDIETNDFDIDEKTIKKQQNKE